MWAGSLSHYLIFTSYVYNSVCTFDQRCTKTQNLLSFVDTVHILVQV